MSSPQDPLFDSKLPIALYPVRLETRFVQNSDGTADLQVRIYPDGALLADSHEPTLSDAEKLAAIQYAASRDAPAYAQLCERFGEPRAAFIVEQPVPAAPSTVQPGGYTRTPAAMLMPTRWMAVAYRGGQPVVVDGNNGTAAWSAKVSGALPLGPGADPSLPAWLVDFDAALDAGMALTLHLASADPIDRLIVVGVDEVSAPATAGANVEQWIDKQRFTHGLAFVAQGTPTRNSPAGPSGYSARPGSHSDAFTVETAPAPIKAGSAGDLLARALGVRATKLAHVAGAATDEQREARDMLCALWPVTWGYYLEQLMDPLVDRETLNWARDHALGWLRARGSLSALRVGDHIYGVTPVAALDDWIASDDTDGHRAAKLVDILKRAAPLWAPAVDAAPTVWRGTDPEAALLQVLRQTATSVGYAATTVRGSEFYDALSKIFGGWLQDTWKTIRFGMADKVLSKVGITGEPKLGFMTWELPADGNELPLPLVAASPSESDPLKDDFIGWMVRTAGWTDLLNETFPGDKGSIFYKLLRHSVMLAYVSAARVLLKLPLPAFIDAEFIAALSPLLPGLLLLQPLPAGTAPEANSADLLQKIMRDPNAKPPFPHYETDAFCQLRDSLGRLSGRATAPLERLVAETLDVASHRLDAWVTSIAARRLDEVRAKNSTGVRVGAYGWAEDLRPANALPVAEAPPGEEGGPLVTDGNNSGYLLAPSLGQATSAAVLRSGQLSHDAALTDQPMFFDLSSVRVRLALEILDGVRGGQPLTALLGYRFERTLHESGLDRYVAPLRALYPPIAQKRPDTAADQLPVESLAPSNVVDAVALHLQHRAGKVPFGSAGLPANGDSDFARLNAALDGLDDMYASVADVLIAEGVHQLVHGNPTRATAALEAISLGESVPADLEFLRTARTGVGVVERLGLLFDASDAGPHWPPPSPRNVRAQAAPAVDRWLGRWFGDPDRVRCVAQPLDGKGAPLGAAVEVALSSLGLSPLDALALAAGNGAELEARVTQHVLASPDTAAAVDCAVDLTAQGATPSADAIDAATFLSGARLVRDLFARARPMDARDLLPAGAAATATGVDEQDLAQRASAAAAALAKLPAALAATTVPALADALLDAAHFGIGDAIPTERDLKGLRARADVVLAAVAKRMKACADAQARTDGDAVSRATAVLQGALGADFPIMPSFAPANAGDLAAAIAAGPAATDEEPFPVLTWLERAARARAGAGRLQRALTCAEALGGGTLVDLRALQLPAGATWAGGATRSPPAGLTSIALAVTAAPSASAPWCGLLVDEWQEIVPNAEETAAVAFPYDDPPNRAPHAILLAVPPEPPGKSGSWTYARVEHVVRAALDLAHYRAVDGNALFAARFKPGTQPAPDLNQFLPAIYLANNVAGEAVSTTFVPQIGGGG